MSELKELRSKKKITQQQAADYVGISLRSYKSYENDKVKEDTLRYRYILENISKINPISETTGILSVQDISNTCATIFDNYNIDFCYLFGSYAKGNAKEDSDIDLLISSDLKGLKYYGMIEELRQKLHKKVDALSIEQLNNNPDLTKEILKDGVKIYG